MMAVINVSSVQLLVPPELIRLQDIEYANHVLTLVLLVTLQTQLYVPHVTLAIFYMDQLVLLPVLINLFMTTLQSLVFNAIRDVNLAVYYTQIVHIVNQVIILIQLKILVVLHVQLEHILMRHQEFVCFASQVVQGVILEILPIIIRAQLAMLAIIYLAAIV